MAISMVCCLFSSPFHFFYFAPVFLLHYLSWFFFLFCFHLLSLLLFIIYLTCIVVYLLSTFILYSLFYFLQHFVCFNLFSFYFIWVSNFCFMYCILPLYVLCTFYPCPSFYLPIRLPCSHSFLWWYCVVPVKGIQCHLTYSVATDLLLSLCPFLPCHM